MPVMKIVALVMFHISEEEMNDLNLDDLLVNGLEDQAVKLKSGDYENILMGTILAARVIE